MTLSVDGVALNDSFQFEAQPRRITNYFRENLSENEHQASFRNHLDRQSLGHSETEHSDSVGSVYNIYNGKKPSLKIDNFVPSIQDHFTYGLSVEQLVNNKGQSFQDDPAIAERRKFYFKNKEQARSKNIENILNYSIIINKTIKQKFVRFRY